MKLVTSAAFGLPNQTKELRSKRTIIGSYTL